VLKRVWIGCLAIGLVAVVVGVVQVVTWKSEPCSEMFRADGTVTARPEEAIGIACGMTRMRPVVLVGGGALTVLGFILRLYGAHWERRSNRSPYFPGSW
jgi:hypothetical protein